jgi:leucyl aminopeptidase (aminopeptidase T)
VSSARVATVDFDLANAARRIIEGALGVVAGERVVLLADAARQDLGVALLETARVMGAKAVHIGLDSLGERPLRRVPDSVRAELETAQASVLLAGFEEGEQNMRFELVTLVHTLGLRHAHMIGVSRQTMRSGFSVDPARVAQATRAIRARLRPESVLHLRTAAGSDLEIKLDRAHRWMEHLGVIRPGRWENLPSGEIVTAPGEVRGVFVADASIGGHFGQEAGLLASKPVRLEIDGGYCKAVRSNDRALQRDLERFMRGELYGDRVGCVSLGTNLGILAPIGDVSCDQNMPGLHIGFGSTFADQTGASWNARSQLTFTCAQADVDLDGAPLLRRGRYMLT